MFVMTVDQRRSRNDIDRVEELLRTINRNPLTRPFERTAGDEVQAVTDDPDLVVTLTLELVQRGHWSTGIGFGPVEEPLPASTRAGRGPAFESARLAVNRAKSAPTAVAVEGVDAEAAQDAEAALAMLALIVARRSPQGHDAVQLMRAGLSQTEAAGALGISKQAVSQRLAAAGWQPDVAGRTLAGRLLRRTDQ